MDFGSKIRKARIKKNISQVQLAEALGTTQPLLAAYENNKRIPKLDTLERIAAALDISVLSLLPSDLTHGAVTPSTPEEKELFDTLAVLNQEGKKKVCEYAADLAGNVKYRY